MVVRVRFNRSYPGARPLPPGHDGSRYSLHRRAECWDQANLARLHDTHPLVRSLTICASGFDADELTAFDS